MSENNFVDVEIAKIFKNKKYKYPLNVAMASVWILANFKGSNLKILDISKQSSLADYFVIGSANNPTQADAMADQIGFMMKKHEITVKSVEGKSGQDWTLIDLGDVIIHIFQESARPTYDLESLYPTSSFVKIPEAYYFPESEEKKSNTPSDDENYF